MNIRDLEPGSYRVIGSGNALLRKQPPKKSVGQKVLDAGSSVAKFFGAKGISEQFGADIARLRSKPDAKNFVSYPTQKQVVGSAIQTGANFIPGVGKGVGLLGKVAAGAATGYAFDVGSKLQNDTEAPFKPGVGTAIGAGLPVAGAVVKPFVNIGRRLVKNLTAGLSGASPEMIERIVDNPKVAQEVSKRLKQSGNDAVLESNAKTVLNGISKIKSEARSAYGKGLESLAKEDINPQNLKEGFFDALSKNKVSVSDDGVIDFSGADFLDDKIQEKARKLIDTINSQEDLSGAGVRKLIDIVDNNKFRSAPDGDRQAFNAFVNDLKTSLREGVGKSTPKLDQINKQYSTDIQLAETVEDIFNDIDFRNLSEIRRVSKKLEGLFNQTGLDPKIVDDFLTRIGIKSEDFRTGEAVRQLSNKAMKTNDTGLSLGEMIRAGTSAVVTPQLIKSVSIATGMAEQKVSGILNKMNPDARKVFIQTALSGQNGQPKTATSLVTNLSIATGLAKEELVPFLNSLQPAMRNAVIQALIQSKNE